MPTVPKLTQQKQPASVIDTLERPPAKVKNSTPADRPNARLETYDDLIAATEHLSPAERMAIRWPAILSDPAAFGGGVDLQKVIDKHVPPPDETEGY